MYVYSYSSRENSPVWGLMLLALIDWLEALLSGTASALHSSIKATPPGIQLLSGSWASCMGRHHILHMTLHVTQLFRTKWSATWRIQCDASCFRVRPTALSSCVPKRLRQLQKGMLLQVECARCLYLWQYFAEHMCWFVHFNSWPLWRKLLKFSSSMECSLYWLQK